MKDCSLIYKTLNLEKLVGQNSQRDFYIHDQIT